MSEETKHSPEPWRVCGEVPDAVEDCEGRFAAEGWARSGYQFEDEFEAACAANARRIVACVNALAGVPTEALEGGALGDLLRAARVVADESEPGACWRMGMRALKAAVGRLR